MRIFIVDDHRDVAEGLADVLRMHGHEVEVAHNGEQAVRIFKEQDFDIAFMDVMMPGMNGVESFLEIRKIKPDAKVVMMTGYSVTQLLDQAIENGAYGVLHKPVSMDEVLNSVERVDSQGMVLVADDDPNFSANMVEVLKDKGYRVQVARTGKQALDTVLGGGIDILVLDLQLPVVSGLEVYMELQKRGRALPTVCVTGYSQDQADAIDQLSSLSAGILTKPFNTNQLLEVLGNIKPGGAHAAPEAPAIVQPQQDTFPSEGFDDPGAAAPAPPAAAPASSATVAPAIPASAPAASPSAAPSVATTEYGHGASSQASSGRGRIIAVDDDVDMVDGLAEVLDAHGYEVKTANDQDGAIKTIQEYDAQVALLDIRLGNSNGLDLISRLKEYRPNLYCIVITGNADKESAVTALRNGAYDYMTKPLHPNELFSVIERCLDKHRLEQRADAAFDALQIAKDAAESASMSKSQFFATMSRELRKPITAIMNSSGALIEEAHGSLGAPQYMEHARNIRNGSSHLLGIISYALDMAEAEAGRLTLNESEVDVNALVSTAARVVQQTHRAEHRKIEVNVLEPAPKVWCDQRQLKQIVMNLLSNAVKFTGDDGQISLTMRWNDQGGLAIEVKDTGIGIAKADIPKAMAQFGRVDDQSVPRERQGAGLGLPLVAAMTKLHGGKLMLESQPGVGTTATVHLPAERIVSSRSAAE